MRQRREGRSRYPKLFADLAKEIAAELVSEPVCLDPDRAATVGLRVAEIMKQRWAGQKIYFPCGEAWSRQLRDRTIREEHAGGAAVDELARRHGMSPRHLRRILGLLP